MATELTIANAVLAWLNAVRPGSSAATRYFEAEFGATLGASSSSLLVQALSHPDIIIASSSIQASPHADVESREDYKKFFSSAESKGFFKGTNEGSPEYAARLSKLVDKFRANVGLTAPAPAVPVQAVPTPAAAVNDDVSAEAAKMAGNKAVEAGQHRRAIELYTDAIVFAPSGKSIHVYYANRAAAKLSLKDFEGAAEDARSAVAADKTYAKGWSRLGGSLVELENYTDAVEAYEKCVSLDPSNKMAVTGLADAKSRQRLALRAANAPPRNAVSAANDNPLAGMAGMLPPGMDMGKMAGMAAMAQGDPELMAAMADPELMPIFAAMQREGPSAIMKHLGNPKVMALAGKMMGKMGGMGGMGM